MKTADEGLTMRQYLYISTARNLSLRDVEKIVAQSERKNAERGIGGFLVFNGANFLQVIEGQRDALDRLMADLADDPRHNGIVRLADIAPPQAVFTGWRMRSFAAEDSPSIRRFALGTELPAALDPALREMVLNFAKLN
ncbi:BLUF domain-containing protein [Altererythrobacter lauratis]|uniref:BLUF domain-containing protein n=1 Tax=Alteraurantiacibacter lauratis TaxID=2054627 RepID=A0ABV7EE57_9SPHN